ncbi:MAG TPA: hypothetical protein VGE98_07290, partial [Thermoanaerobaculia bacterium]
TLYAFSTGGLLRSLDGGDSWSDVAPVPAIFVNYMVVDPLHPGTLYLSGGNGEIRLWRSDDRGDHWTPLPTRDSNYGAFALDLQHPGRLYYGASASGVDRSEDGGATWTPAGFSASSSAAVAVDPQQPATLWASAIGGGVMRSTDRGAHWQLQNDGLVVTRTIPGAGPATYTAPVAVARLVADPANPGTVYAGTDGGVFKSLNSGASWVGPYGAGQLSTVADLAVDPLHPNRFYAAGVVGTTQAANRCGFAVSSGGATWNGLSCPGATPLIGGATAVDPASGRVLAVALNPFGLVASDDGTTLHPFGSGLPTPDSALYYSARLAFDPTSAGTVLLTTGALLNGVYRSTDSGAHWTAAANGLPGARVQDLLLDPHAAGTLYVATDRGVFASSDRGTSWSPLGEGLTRPAIALAADPDSRTLVASTDRGGLFALTRGACADADTALCVQRERFRVEVRYRLSDGTTGSGHALSLGGAHGVDGPDTAGFWFFTPDNVDLVVKVLDGGATNGNFWVFYGALSNVQYTITVTDTSNGARRVYRNPQGHLASHADTAAFPVTSSTSRTASAAARPVPPASRSVARDTAPGGGCDPTRALCLADARYRVEVAWTASGQSGSGVPQSLTDRTGGFWFFDPSNVELLVKVLDGTAVNGHVWVFFGALSDVRYTVTVTDTATGRQRVYTNPRGTLASVADVTAF